MKEAVEHSKITFENMLKQWYNLSDKQRKEIQSNIDYLNEQLTIPAVVVSEERAELCDNPNCEDGIVDRDYYGHPIYCQVCESHN